ncbi:MAG: malto-oligosyltrehalose synthase [Mycobacteriales bacterium]
MRPTGTYRVQVTPDFDMFAAAGLAGYLAALGVSHLYSAPLLTATTGSTHGYDVVDHRRADPHRGGERGRRALVAALRSHRLGLVLDLVPNHAGVAVPAENAAWWDVLKLGPQSAYGRWFDIDWSRGRLLLPVLADSPTALDDLRLVGGELRYLDKGYPLAPGTDSIDDPRRAHDHQHYELVSWRRGSTEHNYRRFFAISELAGLRVEDEAVFAATHAEVLRWVAEGDVDGLRIDHPDGLTDPAGYLDRLACAASAASASAASASAASASAASASAASGSSAGTGDRATGTWIVVEKILQPGEDLPDWPVAGTTGYDALAEVDGVLVDPSAEDAFTALDTRLTGVATQWPDLVHDCKLDVARGMLRAEVRRLAGLAPAVPGAEETLAELLACFPVYRSYLPDGAEHLEAAVDRAVARRPDLAAAVAALADRLAAPDDPLALRFQQTSAAVTAKGVEDTAYYRWTRFVALNEVGGDPDRFGLPLPEFHAALTQRQEHHPAGMTTLSTHDTKRSADVRARLAVLSELPAEWAAAAHRWSARAPAPDGALGHLLWQTVVGAWPLTPDRLHRYLEKAMREARTRTGWNDPDRAFEAAMHAVADSVLAAGALHDDVAGFVARVEPYGWSNALTAALVQLTMPGVPDTYQGGELWDLSLVDPDNRRPVDYELRRSLLARLDDGWQPPVDESGAAKLLVVSRALRLRRDRAAAFSGYQPLLATGAAAEHAVAFSRGDAVTVGTRLPVRLARDGGWRDSALPLPDGDWLDVLTGRPAAGPLAELLATYPVALLARP